ncbi:stAR-related lipid transfer protein 7, mitochondrial [Empidonax traillii]|uniref:stAR-related lipid transfer protein 7, mitochondrial n=1 Tax=Empidonax traillii TaxID=164674 RepID=UPI000FFD8D04|nr:stAR-related lipid transfer protein 7, mitochondrial [Empidonax traillii]
MWRALGARAARSPRGGIPGTPRAGTAAGTPRDAPAALLARQCSCVTAHGARRARRAWPRGHGEGAVAEGGGGGGSGSGSGSGSGWGGWWRGALRGRPALAGPGRLMAALAGVFVWDGRRIEEEELRRCVSGETPGTGQPRKGATGNGDIGNGAPPGTGPWEWDTGNGIPRSPGYAHRFTPEFFGWECPRCIDPRYRVFGSYTDVTPRQFFNVQLDTEYRKKWDSLVIKLDVIERDVATGSEVIHWVTHFPYPMYSRDYVYVRRYNVDKENNLMVLVSRAVEHPSVPEDPEYVRVRTYESQMVIRPHKTFDENGFDYLLTYSDNPQTVFPRYCVSWMVSSGMPDFLEKLHSAALKAKKMELEVRDYLSKGSDTAPEPCGPAQLEYA